MFNRKEYSKQYRLKNKEKIKELNRKWTEKNREKYIQYHKNYNKKWYIKNKEKHDARGKSWRKNPENKKKMVQYVQKYVRKNKEKVYTYGKNYNRTISGNFRTTKSNAPRRGYEFCLSFKQFKEIVLQPCIYCGETENRRGIDRVDNAIGYTKENSASCCKICNYMKKTLSVQDFLAHIKKIYEFRHL